MEEPKLTKEEAEHFITEILKIKFPETYPPNIEWINHLIRAFQRRLPFQNISFISQESHTCVPTWKDIYKEIILEGKGGLCLSLNIALKAVLSSLGIVAFNVAADYVASNSRGVHAITVFHIFETKYSEDSEDQKICQHISSVFTRSRYRKSLQNQFIDDLSRSVKCEFTANSFLSCENSRIMKHTYLADVGCGYPTLQAIDLKEDLKKIFVNCNLEYCITKKNHRYIRMHRTGHEFNEGEEDCVDSEGWLPVFSFKLIPRPISYFRRSMKSIYVNRKTSPYFTELHTVIYLNMLEMVAIKNEDLVKYFPIKETCNKSEIEIDKSKLKETNFGKENKETDLSVSDCTDVNTFSIPLSIKNELSESQSNNQRVQLNEDELYDVISQYFPMIPIQEVEKALTLYFSMKNKSFLISECSEAEALIDQT